MYSEFIYPHTVPQSNHMAPTEPTATPSFFVVDGFVDMVFLP